MTSAAKTGRNDPCPCGSGIKFKKCHGSPVSSVGPTKPKSPSTQLENARGLAPDQTTASVQLGGFPGQSQRYVVVNEFKDGRPSNPAGHEGEYKVVFVFSRPGRAQRGDREISFDLSAEGDSHLSLNAPISLAVDAKHEAIVAMHLEHAHNNRVVKLVCRPNSKGFIASAEATLQAQGFKDAESAASRALTPALSMWSVTLNIPLHVQQVQVTETRTGNAQISAVNPFYDAPAQLVHDKGLSEDFLWFGALYREAANTNSVLYRFLCIYKIIEGIVVRRGATKIYPREKERVPAEPSEFNDWLQALFPVRPERWDSMALDSVFVAEALGKSCAEIRDKFLRPIRNDIGHLFGDDDTARPRARLWIDDPDQISKVHHWLPLATCIARLMLKNEFPDLFLSGLDVHGKPRSAV